MNVFCTTARSVPDDSYISSHACSNPRENPTSATNAPIPIPIPHKVRHVLRRLRHTFFQAKFASVNVELIPLPDLLLVMSFNRRLGFYWVNRLFTRRNLAHTLTQEYLRFRL